MLATTVVTTARAGRLSRIVPEQEVVEFLPGFRQQVRPLRPCVMDEDALVDALASGRLSAVGADVLVAEPEPEKSPLWRYAQQHDNVVITPHIGGFCPDAVDHVVAFTCQRILDHFADDPR